MTSALLQRRKCPATLSQLKQIAVPILEPRGVAPGELEDLVWVERHPARSVTVSLTHPCRILVAQPRARRRRHGCAGRWGICRNESFCYEQQDELEQKVRVWGDTAVVTALLWMKGTTNGKPFDRKLWFSDTYVRTAAGWRYVLGQASLALPPD